MEYLRWILLAVAVAVVASVYLRGRAKRRFPSRSPLDAANDMPSFGARDDAGEVWKDGVGPVRVVGREELPVTPLPMDRFENVAESEPETQPEAGPAGEIAGAEVAPETADPVQEAPVEVQPETPVADTGDNEAGQPARPVEENTDETEFPHSDIGADDVIVLYVVADRGEELKGEQILSAGIAAKLEYGEMDIFHHLDANNKIQFSMANMMEPGTFDYERMNEMKTRGVSLFIQLGMCDDAVEALDEMLICAHTMATMLNARMCDAERRLLNETVVRALREKARYYHQLKQQKQPRRDS